MPREQTSDRFGDSLETLENLKTKRAARNMYSRTTLFFESA